MENISKLIINKYKTSVKSYSDFTDAIVREKPNSDKRYKRAGIWCIIDKINKYQVIK